MASSDDFKKQLKAGKIADALATALSQALELEITTWVASSSDADIEASSSGAELARPGHRLRTRINLIESKIENEIGNQFIGSGPYRELRQFHQEQVADGHKIIQNNLNSLQKLFGILVRIQPQNLDAPMIEPESSDGTDAQVWEDWGVEEASQKVPGISLEAPSLEFGEDWGDMLEGKPTSVPLSQPSLDWLTEEDWGDMLKEPTLAAPALSQEVSSLETDEDWGDMQGKVQNASQSTPVPTSNSSFEEWPINTPTALVAVPTGNGFSLASGIEEHWEDFEVEELEPQPAVSGAISTEPPTPTPVAEEDFEDLDALGDFISLESELQQNSDYDFLVEDFEDESFTQPSPRKHEGTESLTTSSDSLADLFGESLSDVENHEQSLHASPTRAEMAPAAQMSRAESFSIEEALFSETPFDEPDTHPPSNDTISSPDDSDLLAAFDEDDIITHLLPTNESSALSPPPPSQPQNQSKNQSNEK